MTAREIVAALGGTWHGTWGMACCVSHADAEPSLAIRQQGERVLVFCHAGCDQRSVIAALRTMGLWGEAKPSDGLSVLSPIEVDADCRRRIEIAQRIWRETGGGTGSPVETYLRSRGITLPIPADVRYHPRLKHRYTGLELPAMVCAVRDEAGEVAGVHRTFIVADGSGKAPISEPKMALGVLARGAVHLAQPTADLGLAEGVESALSAMQLFGIPCWAALGARMHKVAVPTCVRRVHVFGDGGPEGKVIAGKAVQALIQRGHRGLLRFPPPGFKDFNDQLTALPTARSAAND